MSYTNSSDREATHLAGRVWYPGLQQASPALLLAMFLYIVSLVKFYVRDPLSARIGPQGPIELSLVLLAAVTLLGAFRRRGWKLLWTRPAAAFAAFGALAAVSSIFSYFPLLSFLKGIGFLLVCGIAVAACSAAKPTEIIKYIYYSIIILLVIGLIAKLAGGGPLLEIDDYSGRARFTLFAWHPGTLADLCALTLLSSLVLPKRPPWHCQMFLFAVNIAAASRASSALLVVILILTRLSSVRLTRRFLFLCCCLGSLLTLALLMMVEKEYRPAVAASIGQSLYGDKLGKDLSTLSGRKEVWSAAQPLISHCALLGYGLNGTRDVLVNNTSWSAGDAHNALIDLILAGGFPAMLVYLAGWATAVRHAWHSQGFIRVGALGLYAYIAGFGIVSPNLTYLQGLATFMILTMDARVYEEFSLRESVTETIPGNLQFSA